MATKRRQVTTYVDDPTYKWIAAGARHETRSISQFLAALIANAARAKAPTAGPPVQHWPPVDTSGLFTRPPQQHQPPRATPVAEPEFDPDVWYLAYIKAGEDRGDAEFSVRDECEKRGISGWIVPNEEVAI